MPSPGQRANLSLWWACRPANPMTPQAAPLAEVTLPRGRTWVRSVGAAHGPGGGQPGPGCGTAVRGAECGDPPVGGAPAVIGGHQPQDPALAPGPAATSRRPARPGHRRTRRVEIVAHHFPFTYRAARHATGRPGWCRTGGTSSGAGARCHPRRRKPEANNPYAPAVVCCIPARDHGKGRLDVRARCLFWWLSAGSASGHSRERSRVTKGRCPVVAPALPSGLEGAGQRARVSYPPVLLAISLRMCY